MREKLTFMVNFGHSQTFQGDMVKKLAVSCRRGWWDLSSSPTMMPWLLLAIVRSVVLLVQLLDAMQCNAVQLGITDLIHGAVSETPNCGVLLLYLFVTILD